MTKGNPANIFMVDDDRDDIYTTMRRLSQSKISNGFIYETDPLKVFERLAVLATSGRGDLNVVILLDINMPGTDGFEVLQALREDDRYKDIPVLMLCTSDDVVDMFESFDYGADGYLVKPIVPDQMLAAINELNTHQLQVVQQH